MVHVRDRQQGICQKRHQREGNCELMLISGSCLLQLMKKKKHHVAMVVLMLSDCLPLLLKTAFCLWTRARMQLILRS